MTTDALAAPKEEAKEETKKAAKAKKGEWDPSLPLRGFGKLTPEEYIKERLNPEIKYYSKSATKSKQSYLRMRALSVIGGALVPVLVNIPGPYVDILTTILSLISGPDRIPIENTGVSSIRSSAIPEAREQQRLVELLGVRKDDRDWLRLLHHATGPFVREPHNGILHS